MILFIALIVVAIFSLIWWGVQSDMEGRYDRWSKIWKRTFLISISLLAVLWIGSYSFLRIHEEHKIPTTEIVTGTLINEDGNTSKYYKWDNFILPSNIKNYLNIDTIIMIRDIDLWETDEKTEFIIQNETYAKPRPKVKKEEPSNIREK